MTNTILYHVGDVRDAMRLVDDGLVGLIVTSPPFLALRSYLPDDHPDKDREIGTEATPAAFLETLLALTADWGRALAPWGSIAVEIGDTYSGSGGAGGDYADGGMRQAQPKFRQGTPRWDGRPAGQVRTTTSDPVSYPPRARDGWPMAKSLCLIPHLYAASLAYGRHLLTGDPSPAGMWRARNLLTWTRPNPPVGALGDKFRPATSFVTVACVGVKRWFDLDAVREPHLHGEARARGSYSHGAIGNRRAGGDDQHGTTVREIALNPAGAPPRDWWDANDLDPDELAEYWRVEQILADWQPLHRLPTSPYKGSHYATYPEALPRRLIEAMCPREVCTVCGEPRRRIVAAEYEPLGDPERQHQEARALRGAAERGVNGSAGQFRLGRAVKHVDTVGWTDCGHDAYTPGIVLDPFGGSGTTGVAAARAGRDAILVDIDARNRDLARARIAEQLRLVDEYTIGTTTVWTVEPALPAQRTQVEGQRSIFDELGASA